MPADREIFSAESTEKALSWLHDRVHSASCGGSLSVERQRRKMLCPKWTKHDARTTSLLCPGGASEPALAEQLKLVWGVLFPLSIALESDDATQKEALDILQACLVDVFAQTRARLAADHSLASDDSDAAQPSALQHQLAVDTDDSGGNTHCDTDDNDNTTLRSTGDITQCNTDDITQCSADDITQCSADDITQCSADDMTQCSIDDGDEEKADKLTVVDGDKGRAVPDVDRPTDQSAEARTSPRQGGISPRSMVPVQFAVDDGDEFGKEKKTSLSQMPKFVNRHRLTGSPSRSSQQLAPVTVAAPAGKSSSYVQKQLGRMVSKPNLFGSAGAAANRPTIGKSRSWLLGMRQPVQRSSGTDDDDSRRIKIEVLKQRTLGQTPPRHLQPYSSAVSGAEPVFNRAVDDFVPIWDGTRDPAGLTLRDPKSPDEAYTRFAVRLGTLNKLIELATSPLNPHVPDEVAASQEFVSVFITTFRSFVAPDILVKKLTDRFNVPAALIAQAADPAQASAEATHIRRSVVLFLRLWFRFAYDTFDPESTQLLYAFVEQARAHVAELDRQDKLWAGVRLLEKTVEKKFADASYLASGSRPRRVPRNPPTPLLPAADCINWSHTSFLDISSLEIARQLCIVDFDIYAAIRPSEFFNLAWTKPALQHNAPNISLLISRFNYVASFTAGLILSADSIEQRAAVYEKLIGVAQQLRSLGNYNSLMAVIGAYSNAAVKRLRHTQALVPAAAQSALTDLRDLMSSFQSFKNFRHEYAAAKSPAVPFLGVFLSDLVFVEEGNKDSINGLINFAKRAASYAIIQEVLKHQAVPYELKSVPELQAFISRLPRYTDDELYERSLEFEPRETATPVVADVRRERASGTRRLELPFVPTHFVQQTAADQPASSSTDSSAQL